MVNRKRKNESIEQDNNVQTLNMSIDIGEWESKLIGKKIIPSGGQVTNPDNEFSEDAIKSEVPAYRILKPNSMVTMDYNEDRINVYVDDVNNIVERGQFKNREI
ncbi:hypothetical protein Bhyg_12474, partial [Pseudolycoriella hygida]